MSALRSLSLALVLLVWIALPAPVHAYQIGSAVTSPCHEEMTLGSLALVLDGGVTLPLVAPPPEDEWLGAAESLLVPLAEERPEFEVFLDEGRLEFFAFSMVLGARAPDTAGRASTSANALRRAHLDVSADGQHRHCLRGPDDDGASADLVALEGAASVLAERIEHALLAREEVERAPFFLDHHGDVKVPVSVFGLALGTALHTLEDAHAHTIRTTDGRYVLSVLNFAEAAVGELDEGRDGLAHSVALDDCRAPELRPLVELAVERGAALIRAALSALDGDGAPLARGLDDCPAAAPDASCGWFEYEASCREGLESGGDLEGTCCALDSDLCESEWLPVAREALSEPLLSCAYGAPRTARGVWMVLLGAPLLLVMGRRRGGARVRALGELAHVRRMRVQTPGERAHVRRMRVTVAALALCLAAPAARGEAAARPPEEPRAGELSLAVEAHGSVLSDESSGSLTDVTFGPGLRARVRLPVDPRVSWVLHVEQNSWMAFEQDARLEPGVLSLGTGISFDFAPRLSTSFVVGSSLLLFDTALASAGSAGFFVDLRPLTVGLPLSENWLVDVTPLGISWEAPVLVEPMISLVHYRLTLAIAWNSSGR